MNNSKNFDNLNIDGDINNYVYNQLKDLAIRNTNFDKIGQTQLVSNNNNYNKPNFPSNIPRGSNATPNNNILLSPSTYLKSSNEVSQPKNMQNSNFILENNISPIMSNVSSYKNSKNNLTGFNPNSIQTQKQTSDYMGNSRLTGMSINNTGTKYLNDYDQVDNFQNEEIGYGSSAERSKNNSNLINLQNNNNNNNNNNQINIKKIELNEHYQNRKEDKPNDNKEKDKKKALEKWEVYHAQGYAARKKENYPLAIELYTKAINLKPKYFKALFNRGFAYDKIGEYDRAINDYTKAIEVEPNNAYAYYNRAISHDKKGDVEKTLEDFSTAIKILPTKIDFYLNRAYAFRKIKDYSRAVQDYTEVIKLEKDNLKGYYNRALCYEKLEKFEEAENDLIQAYKLEENNINVLHHLANTRDKLEKIDLAIDDYLKYFKELII